MMYIGKNQEGQNVLSEDLFRESERMVNEGYFGPNFVKPAYDSFCFSNLPGFIEAVLTGSTTRRSLPSQVDKIIGDTIDKVVFIFLDAFGWEALERFKERSPFLQKILSDGRLLKATSQFPSTTVAHVTTINSGLPVWMTGICEWHYYEPNVDGVIIPFRLEFVPERTGRTVFTEGYSFDDFLPKRSFVVDLERAGVRSYSYGPCSYYPGDYGAHFDYSAEVVGYRSVSEGIERMMGELRRMPGKQFHKLYLDSYDALRHDTGPYSPEADAEAIRLLGELEKLLQFNDAGRTLLIFTADHGQVPIDSQTEVVVNQEIPTIENYLARTKKGEIIRFGGGPRDLLL